MNTAHLCLLKLEPLISDIFSIFTANYYYFLLIWILLKYSDKIEKTNKKQECDYECDYECDFFQDQTAFQD